MSIFQIALYNSKIKCYNYIIKRIGDAQMDGKIFRVTRIDGEYAYLTPLDGGDEVFIAIYLLPLGADIGTLLICESFSFSIYEG